MLIEEIEIDEKLEKGIQHSFYKNPSYRTLFDFAKKMIENNSNVRGFVHPETGDVYFWNGKEMTHYGAVNDLSLETEFENMKDWPGLFVKQSGNNLLINVGTIGEPVDSSLTKKI